MLCCCVAIMYCVLFKSNQSGFTAMMPINYQQAVDGVVVNTITSPCLAEAIAMDFDRETMPGWMALPDPTTLPDVPFVVDYIRSWRKTH